MMRKGLLCVCTAILCLSGQRSYAADDVYVDLSVLDAVPQEHIGFIPSQPLFPVVKEVNTAPKVVRPRQKASAPIFVPTVKPAVPAIEQKTAEPIITPEIPQKAPEEDKVPVVTEDVDNAPTMIPLVTKRTLRNLSSEEASPEKTTGEPIVLIPEQVQKEEPSTDEKVDVQKDSVIQVQPLPTPVAVLTAKTSDTSLKQTGITPREIYSLQFVADSSELSTEAKHMLTEMIQKFDPDRRKKISIKAHNYEAGEDSFRKKRISLNRATTVRSFFLNQGFKNFSIKILNTTVDDDYKDTVEIEELD